MKDIEGKDIEFFGKITASMTHEFKNVLAIIKESAGLMEDITKIAPLSESRHQEKLDNALKTIKNQLDRGMELSTVFNRFAHAPDKSVTEINLAHLAEQVVTLSKRFARLKHITLEAAPPEETRPNPQIQGNPVWHQLAVFTGIECCLNALGADSVVSLTSESCQEKKCIRLDCTEAAGDADQLPHAIKATQAWEELGAVMKALDGRIQWLDDSSGFRLIFQ